MPHQLPDVADAILDHGGSRIERHVQGKFRVHIIMTTEIMQGIVASPSNKL